MASNNSIKRALLRPGHFLSLHSDRQLYVSPVQSLGGFSVLLESAGTGCPVTSANESSRLPTPGGKDDGFIDKRQTHTFQSH